MRVSMVSLLLFVLATGAVGCKSGGGSMMPKLGWMKGKKDTAVASKGPTLPSQEVGSALPGYAQTTAPEYPSTGAPAEGNPFYNQGQPAQMASATQPYPADPYAQYPTTPQSAPPQANQYPAGNPYGGQYPQMAQNPAAGYPQAQYPQTQYPQAQPPEASYPAQNGGYGAQPSQGHPQQNYGGGSGYDASSAPYGQGGYGAQPASYQGAEHQGGGSAHSSDAYGGSDSYASQPSADSGAGDRYAHVNSSDPYASTGAADSYNSGSYGGGQNYAANNAYPAASQGGYPAGDNYAAAGSQSAGGQAPGGDYRPGGVGDYAPAGGNSGVHTASATGGDNSYGNSYPSQSYPPTVGGTSYR